MSTLCILLVIYLVQALVVGRWIHSLIRKEKRVRRIEASKDELPFVRDDYHSWNTPLMVITAAFLLVPRCLLFLVATFCHYLVVKVVVVL